MPEPVERLDTMDPWRTPMVPDDAAAAVGEEGDCRAEATEAAVVWRGGDEARFGWDGWDVTLDSRLGEDARFGWDWERWSLDVR